MMREPLLERNPDLGPVSSALLVGIANAIEQEAVARYTRLGDIMARRGEAELADAFRTMLEEERAHVDAVSRWAASLGEAIPDVAAFRWRLPPELSKAWDEAAGSALFTPYRAFALAVDNEQRAFALYSYLAAQADDADVRSRAEMLAAEELRHAAVMRRWRREAWHREGRGARLEPPRVVGVEELHALLAAREATIAHRLSGVAERLRRLGDEQSAAAVEEALRRPSRPPHAQRDASEDVPDSDHPLRLLTLAQAALESLAEILETILHRAEGELFAEGERALANVIGRIATISLQAERRLQQSEPSRAP
jgi:rubrerythrin